MQLLRTCYHVAATAACGAVGGRWVAVRLLALVTAIFVAGVAAAGNDSSNAPQALTTALRSLPGAAPSRVLLPDRADAPPGSAGSFRPVYRLDADLGPDAGNSALYLPGVFNRSRIRVNGHLVFDSLDSAAAAPRGVDRLLLAPLPEEFVRPGRNQIEIELAGVRTTRLSAVWIGPEPALRRMYTHKRWWQVFAPVVAASVVVALSACVLLLWARRPNETLYAYFGVGGLFWSLHNVWTVIPDPWLRPPHFGIWWTLGFAFFIAPLVVFCIRLAQWRVPRFERALWFGLVSGPLLLYGAQAAEALEAMLAVWRLAWLGAVGVGVCAVGRYALRQRTVHGALLLATGVVAFAFGAYDWWADRSPTDNNPVLLTHFSGLLFFPLIAWLLIDGFVQAARELEQLNAGLERRVAEKGAELRDALDAMRSAKDRAEAADRAKSSFLAAASHDLRQPMHALGLYLSALRCETLSPEQSDLIEHMSSSVDALEGLFDSLLDVSRIDAGAVEPARRVFAIEPMLQRLAGDLARETNDKGLRLAVRAAPAVARLNAYSDPLLVERILRNLLANAIKYTSTGGVLLAGRLRHGSAPAGSVPGTWRIEVWDSGPGIPEAERERVFEEFYQLGHPERDRASGFGLGLSIVRRLAALLGHRVALASRLGHGSRFSLEVPATDAQVVPEPRFDGIGALRRIGVAVIDDDPGVRHSMAELLMRWNCDVVSGATGAEVLDRAGTDPATRLHAAVVDFQLRDGRTGLEAIATLREACGSALPVLIVTGASSADRLAAVRASGFPWLAKPVPPARLRSWLMQAALDRPA